MIFFLGMLFLLWNIILMWQIYSFPLTSAPASADAAIVLGAAVWNGQPSPVFEERIKHSIFLFQSGQVEYLIFTGGFGKHDTIAESEAARAYAINEGVPSDNILIETNSHTTYENLYESCKLMSNANMQKAIIVSDPLHMKRAMRIALDIGIDAQPSPTPTTRYQTWRSKSGSLVYELFFYVLHLGAKAAGFVAECPG
ncbi:MAG: YdcF family protein [Chloroflexi bacterium]|nr:MAG: YdcF family protein [Chloroflexota bacterium]